MFKKNIEYSVFYTVIKKTFRKAQKIKETDINLPRLKCQTYV